MSIETPKTTVMRIEAYRRRRGWAAWWTATLSPGMSFEGERPTLEEMQDIRRVDQGQSDAQMLHALRVLKAQIRRQVH